MKGNLYLVWTYSEDYPGYRTKEEAKESRSRNMRKYYKSEKEMEEYCPLYQSVWFFPEDTPQNRDNFITPEPYCRVGGELYEKEKNQIKRLPKELSGSLY